MFGLATSRETTSNRSLYAGEEGCESSISPASMLRTFSSSELKSSSIGLLLGMEEDAEQASISQTQELEPADKTEKVLEPSHPPLQVPFANPMT